MAFAFLFSNPSHSHPIELLQSNNIATSLPVFFFFKMKRFLLAIILCSAFIGVVAKAEGRVSFPDDGIQDDSDANASLLRGGSFPFHAFVADKDEAEEGRKTNQSEGEDCWWQRNCKRDLWCDCGKRNCRGVHYGKCASKKTIGEDCTYTKECKGYKFCNGGRCS